ncbi:hypothetical protein Tco_0255924 [Tanacetum coccineum]
MLARLDMMKENGVLKPGVTDALDYGLKFSYSDEEDCDNVVEEQMLQVQSRNKDDIDELIMEMRQSKIPITDLDGCDKVMDRC